MGWLGPNLRVGGVPITAQNFSWALTAGVTPYRTTFIVPKGPLNDELQAVPNPTFIELQAYGGTRGYPDYLDIIFENVWLLEPKEIDPWHVLWSVADARFEWRGKKLYYLYNKTKIRNERGITVTDEITPAALRKPFDTFSDGRYVNWTMRGQEAPWNMIEIIEDQLKKLGILYDPATGHEGAYTLENVAADGIDIYQGLASLLSMSRLQLGIKASGEVYVYSIDYYDDSQLDTIWTHQTNIMTRPGTLYYSEKKRLRPKKINVKFEKKIECRVVAVDGENTPSNPDYEYPVSPNPTLWTQADIDNWRVLPCQNVIRCPYPIYSYFSKREVNIGEYLPLWEYLLALDPPITEAQIRTKFFLENLEIYYNNLIDGPNTTKPNAELIQNIVGEIKRSYRQLYQISPYHVDRMKFWEAKRCGVINNYDRYSPPSPLFADYCVIPSKRHPSLAKRLALWDESAYNWIVNTRDPYRRQPTSGTISSVNQALGVFSVAYPPLVDSVIKQIIPSGLSPLPGIGIDGNLLEDCDLIEDHTLETVISVVWDSLSDDDYASTKKYFQIPFDYSVYNGEGPEVDYFSSKEYARIAIKEFTALGEPQSDPVNPQNLGVIQAIAWAEAGRLMNQFLNRYAGHVTLADYMPITLVGHMRSVTYSFTPEAGMETTIDILDAPPDPTLEQQLPQSVINFLRRQVPRGETANEVAP